MSCMTYKRMKLLLLLRTGRFKVLLQTHTKLIKQLSTTTEEEGLLFWLKQRKRRLVFSWSWVSSANYSYCWQQHSPYMLDLWQSGHSALKCWNRFDNNYQSNDVPEALAALQTADAT
ncbi:hypothetical protein Bca52824_057595 [Brassica carinata]|uniref:Uncharacterized protein n=1 Tax=Brassica carinata TaxID=52824 RepID=A0A8X7UCV9_BRACI|nr:hypothetical protein Bca52824_057595 [Brassica carinata]